VATEVTMGPLERRAMEVLWAEHERYVPVREVAARLDPGLAYTTVMTLLVRLHAKGLLERRREGRGFRYRPCVSRSAFAAAAMDRALRQSDDPPGVLLHFVGQLTPDEQAALRELLDDP